MSYKLKTTTNMKKEKLQGFISGVIAYYNLLDQINENKCLGFTAWESAMSEHFNIEFEWLTVDVPSSNLDPTDDNSVQRGASIKLKASKDIEDKDLALLITDALDEINAATLITERSEL